MKNTQILTLFIIGTVLVTIGAMFKILKWPFASLFLIVGMTFEAVSGVLLVIKMYKKKITILF